VIKNAIRQTFVLAVVNDGKHTKRAVIDLINSDVAGKVFVAVHGFIVGKR
jgi:hypothetical protein